ncbi:28S ribosomal protein S5, mitochondrial [Microbotryomycetes sp. JL201]|nr:28S ribosomal protein S5, mitochondrial [Microbotryomycetes sp. JL201]
MNSLRRATTQLVASTSRATTVARRHAATTAAPTATTTSSRTNDDEQTVAREPRLKRPELQRRDMRFLDEMSARDLSAFDPILDVHPLKKFTSPKNGSKQPHDVHVTLINDDASNRTYQQPRPQPDLLATQPGQDDSVAYLAQVTDLTPNEIRNLHRYPLVLKRVVNMKTKGKTPSMYSLVVVGNGNGLVGVGEGKDDAANKAVSKAFTQAVRSMDYVDRYDDRTVWGTMESNFGTCKIQMRSRPPGFGLRVNPHIHQVAKAAGITDLSAKVYGSRNPTRVIKLATAMLHGGSNPVDLGGFGQTKGQRKNKKTAGMQTADEVGRSRGRKAVSL